MRKLTVAAFVSLDGVMQAPGAPDEDRSGGFLQTFPVILGGGKRLFRDGAHGIGLRLTDIRHATTGVVISTYERAGPVATGSFSHDNA